MPRQAAALKPIEKVQRYPLDAFLADIGDIGDIEWTSEPTDLKRRSRDFFWYSPILSEQLKDKLADVIVTPKDENEVIRIAAACAKYHGGKRNPGDPLSLARAAL
jgi:hypothetical protein